MDLNDIGNHTEDFNKCFVMVADINLASYAGNQFDIIGNDSNAFTGVFDGKDHKIWNFAWTSEGISQVGIFKMVGDGGWIKNLGMENVDVNAVNGNDIGGLIGINYGTIVNCYSTGSVTGYFYVGGLVGYNEGTITNCCSTSNIRGTGSNVGGMVGVNYYIGTITNCYSTGGVTGGYYYVGGLVGYNNAQITVCYSTGSVRGIGLVGGLVGLNYYSTITNCYSTGSVIGGYDVGGLVGYNEGGSVGSSFWDTETSGQATSAGGEGKTTAEMKQVSTFANWDFVETWGIEDNQTYPFLKLTYPVGDLNHDKKVDFLDFAILAEHWLQGL